MELTRSVLALQQVKRLADLPEENFLVAWQNLQGPPVTYEVSSHEQLFVLAPPLGDLLGWLRQHSQCASRVVIVHNHPAKYWFACLPSDQDLIGSEYLRWQMAALGIELVDSVIVTASQYWSFREHGLLQNQGMYCAGEDILNFILTCLMQMVPLLPEQQADIEAFYNQLEQGLQDIDRHKRQCSWVQRLLRRQDPLFPCLSHQDHPLLEAVAAGLRPYNLTVQHHISYDQLLGFGRFLQEEVFKIVKTS